jgi:hypothetical protein
VASRVGVARREFVGLGERVGVPLGGKMPRDRDVAQVCIVGEPGEPVVECLPRRRRVAFGAGGPGERGPGDGAIRPEAGGAGERGPGRGDVAERPGADAELERQVGDRRKVVVDLGERRAENRRRRRGVAAREGDRRTQLRQRRGGRIRKAVGEERRAVRVPHVQTPPGRSEPRRGGVTEQVLGEEALGGHSRRSVSRPPPRRLWCADRRRDCD